MEIGSCSLKLVLQFTEEMKTEETGEKFGPSELLFQIFHNSGGRIQKTTSNCFFEAS